MGAKEHGRQREHLTVQDLKEGRVAFHVKRWEQVASDELRRSQKGLLSLRMECRLYPDSAGLSFIFFFF